MFISQVPSILLSVVVPVCGEPGDVRGVEVVVHHVSRGRVLAGLPSHRLLHQGGQLGTWGRVGDTGDCDW